jgi:hypothetical protein
MEKFGCLGLLVILLGLGIPISSVGYHPKYSERWGVLARNLLHPVCPARSRRPGREHADFYQNTDWAKGEIQLIIISA